MNFYSLKFYLFDDIKKISYKMFDFSIFDKNMGPEKLMHN